MNAKKRPTHSLKIRLRRKEINILILFYSDIVYLLFYYLFSSLFSVLRGSITLLSQLAWLLSDQWILKIHLTALKQFLSFTLQLPGPSGAGSTSFTSWTSERRQSASRGWGKSCDLDPPFTQGIITPLLCSQIWNACNTPPKFQWTLELHRVQEQTTNVKVPWSSYKLHFGKKLCLYPLQHQPTEANCSVNGPKPHVKSIESGAGIGPARLFTSNRVECTH